VSDDGFYLLIKDWNKLTTLSWIALAQSGCGRFQPINMPISRVISVVMAVASSLVTQLTLHPRAPSLAWRRFTSKFTKEHQFTPCAHGILLRCPLLTGGTTEKYGPGTDQAAKSRRRTGCCLAPQLPGVASNTPAQALPQDSHRPSAVSFQSVSSYQSRPISFSPHW